MGEEPVVDECQVAEEVRHMPSAVYWTAKEKKELAKLVIAHGTGSWRKIHVLYTEKGGTRTINSLRACYQKNKEEMIGSEK